MNNIVDVVPNISVITKIEVLGFKAPDKHTQLLISFMNDANVIDLTSKIVDISINIRKNYKTKLPDAIIAATAIAHNLILISRNLSDFKNIEGLQVIDAHRV